MDRPDVKSDIAAYYDTVAAGYFEQYQRESLLSGKKYPQNYFRLQLLATRLALASARSVYEVGTGEGTPLATLARMGLTVAGCDISSQMVDQTRRRLADVSVEPQRVQWADVEDSLTLAGQRALGPFDAVVAFGVMPHVKKDGVALRNMRMLGRPGSRVFVEFRNKLFSLFTFNRHTYEFILDDLLAGVSDELKKQVAKELESRLALDEPQRTADADQSAYESIKPRFHNPLNIAELFEREGFADVQLHFYHYHAAPPLLEGLIGRQRFWEESASMEHSSSWRGYFLCSAFVVEATAK